MWSLSSLLEPEQSPALPGYKTHDSSTTMHLIRRVCEFFFNQCQKRLTAHTFDLQLNLN